MVSCSALVASAAAVLGTVWLPAPARAMGGGDGCQPTGSNRPSDIITGRHEGYFMWDSGAFDVNAVEANILVYSPWVDYHTGTSGNKDYSSSVSAWVMLQQNNARSAQASYAQDGWLEGPSGGRHDFIEFADPKGNDHQYFFDPAPINNYVTYRTEYNPNDHNYRFYLGDYSSTSARMTVSLGSVGFTPEIAAVSGETHSSADQLPGGSGFYENFYWPQIGDPRGTNYHLSDSLADFGDQWAGIYGKYPGDNQQNLFGINYFGIWDGACAH